MVGFTFKEANNEMNRHFKKYVIVAVGDSDRTDCCECNRKDEAIKAAKRFVHKNKRSNDPKWDGAAVLDIQHRCITETFGNFPELNIVFDMELFRDARNRFASFDNSF